MEANQEGCQRVAGGRSPLPRNDHRKTASQGRAPRRGARSGSHELHSRPLTDAYKQGWHARRACLPAIALRTVRGASQSPAYVPGFTHTNNTRLLIAVVDDDKGMRTAFGRLLRSAGLDVETFPSGAEFLESLHSHHPDCVILDIAMPGLDGLAVQARLTQASIRLPIVVVTAQDSAATRERALAGGASAYLPKPVDGQTLLDAIASAVAQRAGTIPPPEKAPPQ